MSVLPKHEKGQNRNQEEEPAKAIPIGFFLCVCKFYWLSGLDFFLLLSFGLQIGSALLSLLSFSKCCFFWPKFWILVGPINLLFNKIAPVCQWLRRHLSMGWEIIMTTQVHAMYLFPAFYMATWKYLGLFCFILLAHEGSHNEIY